MYFNLSTLFKSIKSIGYFHVLGKIVMMHDSARASSNVSPQVLKYVAT